MPCYHPIKGYKSRTVNPSGKRSIVFKPSEGFTDLPVTLPCGQCVGCRLERSRQWAIRCVHEASLHDENCFITLTFNDQHLNENNSLVKADYQKFMKRLRRAYDGKTIRYYHCGEYGELLHRPHHHACLFNHDFPDKEIYSESLGNKLYTSPTLNKLWPYGYATIGEVTWESAAYCARYIMKKQTGEQGKAYYGDRVPPYTTMSRRPGIGQQWFEKYKSDIYPEDFVMLQKGRKARPPKYYDTQLEKIDPAELQFIKNARIANAKKHEENNTLDRLAIREELQHIRLKQLKRTMETA